MYNHSMSTIDVTPIEIRDYALSWGVLGQGSSKDGLLVLNSPKDDFSNSFFQLKKCDSNYHIILRKLQLVESLIQEREEICI